MVKLTSGSVRASRTAAWMNTSAPPSGSSALACVPGDPAGRQQQQIRVAYAVLLRVGGHRPVRVPGIFPDVRGEERGGCVQADGERRVAELAEQPLRADRDESLAVPVGELHGVQRGVLM